MPFIPDERRPRFDKHIKKLVGLIETDGDAEYVIYQIMRLRYCGEGRNFDSMNRAFGDLVTTILTLYMTTLGPYELLKLSDRWSGE